MKLQRVGDLWAFSAEPFPAYRADIWHGRNKHDRAFLPVKGIAPDPKGGLDAGSFQVIRTREKGTIMIVPGQDATNRILGLISIAGGFRGGVGLLRGATQTADILASAQASSACESTAAWAALFNVGDVLIVNTFGRYGDDVVEIRHDGIQITSTRMALAEYQARMALPEGEAL